MRFLILATLAVFTFFKTSSAFPFQTGDTYEWSSWNLTSYKETPVRVTILDTIAATGNMADSGVVWRLLLQFDSRPADTLKLFEFKDGALRWTHGSFLFPVELQSPHSILAWKRGGYDWGYFNCRGCSEITAIVHTNDGADIESKRVAFTPYAGAWLISTQRIHGVWTDSEGPLWFQSEGDGDYYLKSKNGRKIDWQNLHLDTMRHRASDLDQSIARRRALIRYPRTGDRYVWQTIQNRILVPPSSIEPSFAHTLLTTAIVSDAAPDSSGWIRRTFKVVTDSTIHQVEGSPIPTYSARSDTSFVRQRWDSAGNILYDVSTLFSESWCARAGDVESADGSVLRGSATYLSTGELASQAWSSWRDFKGVCRICTDSRSGSISLLSAPGYATSVEVHPNQTPAKYNILPLRELALQEPQATLVWFALDGRRGMQTVSEFTRARRSGFFRVRIQTSQGAVFEGTVVGM
jgi:hypothetical protein